jgi:hypothetical protein
MPTTVHITDKGNQTISGIKTFATGVVVSGNLQVSGTGIFNAIDLNSIDNLSLSGVDITITSGVVALTNRPTVNGTGVLLSGEAAQVDLSSTVRTTGAQTVSGVKTFVDSGVFSLSRSVPLIVPNNPLSIVGSGNSYVQVNIQNRATGTTATSDLVLTANNGTDTSNYIDIGINNSGYADPAFSNGSGLDGYLIVNGGSLDIATTPSNSAIEFHVGGTTADRVIATINQSGLNIISGTLTASNVVYNTGNQNISGTKNFYTRMTVNGSGVRLYDEPVSVTLPNTVVYTTGNQTISGDKIFKNNIQIGDSQNAIYVDSDNGLIVSGYQSTLRTLKLIASSPSYETYIQFGPGSDGLTFKSPDYFFLDKRPAVQTFSPFSKRPVALLDEVVLLTGNQTISGVKTFFDSGIFSNGGVPAVPLINNPLSVVGSGNNYMQLNIQNRATGLTASADLVITANNGTDNSNFINLGINNSGYSDPLYNNTTGLDGYLIMDGGDLDIGTRTPGKIIEFHAGGTTESKVIARISESGFNLVSGNLTVKNTGVLLSGQNSFIITLYNTSDTQAAGHNYFGNMANSMNGAADGVNRRFPVLESCTVRRASWTQINTTIGNPSLNSTGYFINTTTSKTGIISTTINTQSPTAPNHYTAEFSPPIAISTGDYIVCSLFGPNYATTFPAGQRNTVNIYCYN